MQREARPVPLFPRRPMNKCRGITKKRMSNPSRELRGRNQESGKDTRPGGDVDCAPRGKLERERLPCVESTDRRWNCKRECDTKEPEQCNAEHVERPQNTCTIEHTVICGTKWNQNDDEEDDYEEDYDEEDDDEIHAETRPENSAIRKEDNIGLANTTSDSMIVPVPECRAEVGSDTLLPNEHPPRSPKSNAQKPFTGGKLPYDLGGDAEQVSYILSSRPEWDQETIDELFIHGALPRLVTFGDLIRKDPFPVIECTFQQPDGNIVENIWLPVYYVKMKYPSMSKTLKSTVHVPKPPRENAPSKRKKS